jgi:hypothetical protein
VGIYASSLVLAAAGIAVWSAARREPGAPAWRAAPPAAPAGYGSAAPTVVDSDPGRPDGALWLVAVWALALATFAAVPALLYIGALPGYGHYITGCGKLEKPQEATGALIHVTPPGARQPATLFVDPLCPTCKAFHQRLATEGLLDKLDMTLVLFPLDSECNWMLDRPVHPGSCQVSRAVICGDHRALQVLEWAYERQDDILAAAKAGAGPANVHAMIRQRWPGLEACMDAKETKLRLDHMLRHIVNNRLPVSTPQMFLGDTRLCDEDTDMGLSYSIRRLAPGLRE